MPASLRPLLAIAAFAALPIPCGATSIRTPPVAWGTCPESWVGVPSGALGARLQCARMRAALDHVAPDGREIDVGVVRIRAARPAEREGAIFFNQGGPGMHPGKLLRRIGEAWTGMSASRANEREKRLLAERYDFVAVIPRGLVGSGSIRCASEPEPPPLHDFLPTHPDDANWRRVVDGARATAEACLAPAQARFVNTEQHVHDMDMVRRAIGDERLHFYGISYGGMVGAWYASMYPAHTGRLLLDSTMDIMHGYRAAALLAMKGQQRAFLDNVVAPVLRDPAAYGLRQNADTLATAIDDLPARAREAWTGKLGTPMRLAAALRLVEWLGSDNPPTVEAMARLVDRAQFSNDPGMDRRIRREAGWLARWLYTSNAPLPEEDPESDFVRLAMGCNDVTWPRSESEIRESSRRYAGQYFNFSGDETLEELACSYWGGPSARRPDLTVLGQAAPFLLIQSEKDASTPMAGASHILDAFPNARMLLLRNADLHGAFNFTTSACVERTAARYLLTGALPALPSRAFACTDTFANPVDALPGGPPAVAVEPTSIEQPSGPTDHDEF